MFKPLPQKVDVNQLEQEQMAYWQAHNVRARTVSEREGGPQYVFYEGPPTANGRPGSHHVLARSFKDMFPRYKIMRGYHVIRKGGWDTHGLPVEIEVEKQLGFNHKHQIEEYGIAAFNAKCRESVLQYIDDWQRLTERTAYWVDMEQAYYTFTNDYVQSVWWVLRQLWDQGLLYQGHKVVPYCPRCGTPLSSHEVNLGYAEAKDPSLYVRFKLRDEVDTYFLVWTTTPWTLPANVALAVGENIDYLKLEGTNKEGQTERLIVAETLLDASRLAHGGAKKAKDQDEDESKEPDDEAKDEARAAVFEALKAYQIVGRVKGRDLIGQQYEPLFSFMDSDKAFAYVTKGDFVSTEDGTGIVHMAPAFGADDMEVGRANDLPLFMTVAPDGTFVPQVSDFAGMWVKEADPQIVRALKERGLVLANGKYVHRYPFCWRCGTPLLYYARPTWFIRTSQKRDDLVRLNKTINWVPEHIRDGRFGNWLENNIDWALGRERYWGTPLPVWLCDDPACGERHCIGGVEELSQLAGRDLSELDLHRPYVDEVTWPCSGCEAGTMRRVPELIDVWFDSGAMPVAQWGYPYHGKEMFEKQFPADYICEAVDQTRGWFYSLHAISTLLFDSVAYKNVICLGHILDKEGKKMSKSRGNVIAPWEIIDKYGADVFRWYLYTASPPGEPRRFSVDLVGQSYSSFWLTLWNTYKFFVTYALTENFSPREVPMNARDPLDRWITAELHALIRDVTDAFERYDALGATRPVERFIDQLSNWYVRRSRRRFWEGDAAAFQTLYECLVTLSKLLAPTTPFIAEAIYSNLVGSVDQAAPPSVHLADWPTHDEALIDAGLLREMQVVQRLVSLGHAARASADMRVRQPLASAAYALPADEARIVAAYADIMAEELNVKQVTLLKEGAAGVVEYTLNPLPQVMGRRFGADFPALQKYLREPEQAQRYAADLAADKAIKVVVDGIEAELTAEDVEVRISPAEGYAVAQEGQYLAALDITVTEELAAEGLAREVIRRVQTLRKDADFNVEDRIRLAYNASPRLAAAIAAYADFIKAETLSLEMDAADQPQGEASERYEFDQEELTVSVERVK